MSVDHRFYVGAFLILNNIMTTAVINPRSCSKHGEMTNGVNFCPTCGEKITEKPVEIKVKKDAYWGQQRGGDPLWPVIYEEDRIIMIPNRGGMGDLSVRDNPITFINEPEIEKCKDQLEDSCKEYIDWLVNVQNFDAVVSFGAVEYYS